MPPREIPLAFLLLSALVGHSYAEESCTVGRLLLNDAISPKVAVVDLDSAASLFTFSGEGMPSNAAALTETSDSMCSSINYRASSGVTKILCSGLSFESHGDHDDIVKKTPSVLPDTLTGDNPTHISVSFGQTVVFFDGTPAKGATPASKSYAVSFVDTKFAGATTITPVFESDKMGQQHGNAGALANDLYFVSQPNPLYLTGNSTDSLSVGFLVMKKDKTVVYDMNHGSDLDKRCPGYHGDAHVGSTVMFGCISGVLVLTMDKAANTFTSRRIPYHEVPNWSPGMPPPPRRTGSFHYHKANPVIIGQHTNTTHYAFIRLPTATAASGIYDVARDFREFGTARPCRSGFEKASGKAFLSMFTNGSLLMFDVTNGWTYQSAIQVSEPFTCSGSFPFLVLGYNRAFVVYPTLREAREILISSGALNQGRTMKLPDEMKPTAGLVLGIPPDKSTSVSCPADP
jgi:hypothetical protein